MKNKILILTITALILLFSLGSSALPFNKIVQKFFDDHSLNWAGYYASGSNYIYANATWVVPSVSNGTIGYSSAWVGIGGVNGNGSLIQTGTEQECSSEATNGGEEKFHGPVLVDEPPSNGKKGSSGSLSGCTPVYYAWWETFPANSEQKIDTIAISPGDIISAFVQQKSAGIWIINITDITKGQSFQKTVNFYPDRTTAEVIIERPSLCFVTCELTNLADFGSITFSKAYVENTTGNNYSEPLLNTPITMVDNSFKVMAYPGTSANPGTFSVTRVRQN